ncbi:MAG: helicase-associated domain-containing protein [Planctomycetes bacterium]|nr:helicase-associated domain-containing protein [Planctomycetota bacterium]
MQYAAHNPLIAQSDHTVLLEVDNPRYAEARDGLARFAELVKSPEHFHTYRISALSLWNAASAGMKADEMIEILVRFSKYEVPENVRREIQEYVARYGRVWLERRGDALVLVSQDPSLMEEIERAREASRFLQGRLSDREFQVLPHMRGHIKQALIHLGFPVEDLAGYVEGAPLDIQVRSLTLSQRPFHLRTYQQDAVDAFYAGGSARGGSGVIALPCGAGKTIVGIAIMSRFRTHTLILATSITAVRQWKRELLDKTNLTEDQIGEYSGEMKESRPVTVTTYNIMTYRRRKTQEFPHFELFTKMNWGLILYDEVHLLPAPVFRVTAEIQACRRLGLTATLVREDGCECDVFSLIGPKRYDVPWKELERQGWIASAGCMEVRVPLPPPLRVEYSLAEKREKFRLASENEAKLPVVRTLLERHPDDLVLIIGQYLRQLDAVARLLGCPMITGSTRSVERDRLYEDFRRGRIRRLIVSKVGNFSVDLPDANVLIQVSGTFGSRQEEAQRLGRILRPKDDQRQAHFYSLVSRDSNEQDFSAKRQLFLTEQGYSYSIRDVSEVLQGETAAVGFA